MNQMNQEDKPYTAYSPGKREMIWQKEVRALTRAINRLAKAMERKP